MFEWTVPKQRQPLDIQFITEDVLGVASITGYIYIYSVLDSSVLSKVKLHRGSARSIDVRSNVILSGGSDQELKLTEVNGMSSIRRFEGHESPVSKVKLLDNHLIASGNDDGHILLHDTRSEKLIYKWSDIHDDFISDLLQVDGRTLLSCSGDGFLSVMDVRKVASPNTKQVVDYGLIARSDDLESDLTCMTLMKNGKKVVCGMGNDTECVAGIFQYGSFGDVNDRLILQGSSFECMVKIDEDKVLLGCDQPVLASILPNKCLRTVPMENFSGVEAMALSPSQQLLAVISTDNAVRFVHSFHEFIDQKVPKIVRNKKRKLVTQAVVVSFYADL